MNTFKAYLKKEIFESYRQYRYLVLIAGIFFFAVATPIMNKLLPDILKSQMGSDKKTLSALTALFHPTIKYVLQNYIKDLFQIGTLIVVFTLCGSFSEEITTKKFVFPYAKGAIPKQIVLAKAVHYILVVTAIVICGFFINYYYTTLLFKGDAIPIDKIITSALYMCIYYVFNITLTLFFSSIIKKGIVSGIIVLVISYFSSLLNGVKAISKFSPYRLVATASSFSSKDINETVLIIIIYCVIFILAAIIRMERIQIE